MCVITEHAAATTGRSYVVHGAAARRDFGYAVRGSTATHPAGAALVLFFVVVGGGSLSEAAQSPAFYGPTVAALGSIIALLIALIALFVRQSGGFDTFGVIGFVIAVVGTAMGAGSYWTYVFVLPHLAEKAPGVADESSGSVLAGFVISFFVMGMGWLLFAVATLRTGTFPRWAVMLLMVGSVIVIVPMPSRTLVLAVAVALLAYSGRPTGEADAASLR